MAKSKKDVIKAQQKEDKATGVIRDPRQIVKNAKAANKA